jgi:hypothetical protein
MNVLIDGPMLMGIAAIITSIAGLATALRAWRRPEAATPRKRAARSRKEEGGEGLRA